MRALRAAHRGTIPQQAAPGHAGCARKDASTYFHTQVIQKSSERRILFPSPLAGEGDRAEAKPSEVGRGVIFVKTFFEANPSPGSRSLSLRAIHPLPQGERGSEVAVRPYHLTLIPSTSECHCGSMPASLTTFAHFTISVGMNFSSSSGVLVSGVIASPLSRSCTSGRLRY